MMASHSIIHISVRTLVNRHDKRNDFNFLNMPHDDLTLPNSRMVVIGIMTYNLLGNLTSYIIISYHLKKCFFSKKL